MMQAITSIESTRLVIRPIDRADLPALMSINGDPEVTQFLPYATWTTSGDADAWFARMDALREAGSGQQLVIALRDDRAVVGTMLLFKFDEGSRRVELGYVLGRAHWRQGLMREAIDSACTHAFAALGIRRIEAEVNPANAASCATLLAAGFTHEGTMRQRWIGREGPYDTRIFGRLADDRARS